MAHSQTHVTVTLPISTTPPSQASHRSSLCPALVPRRDVALRLAVGAVIGLRVIVGGDRSADAAARRPPPPPPADKKDPNVSGVLAKVLASKKRKEAMKDSIAKLREKGTAINEPPPPAAE